MSEAKDSESAPTGIEPYGDIPKGLYKIEKTNVMPSLNRISPKGPLFDSGALRDQFRLFWATDARNHAIRVSHEPSLFEGKNFMFHGGTTATRDLLFPPSSIVQEDEEDIHYGGLVHGEPVYFCIEKTEFEKDRSQWCLYALREEQWYESNPWFAPDR